MSDKTPNAEYILWMIIQTFLEDCEIDPAEDLETARLVSAAVAHGVYNALHAVVHGYEMPNTKVVPVITADLAEAAEATMETLTEEAAEDAEEEDEGDWIKDEAYAEAFAGRLKVLRKAFGHLEEEDIEEKPAKKNKKATVKDDEEGSGVGVLSENFVEAMQRTDPHTDMTQSVAGTTLAAQMELDNQVVPEAELRGKKVKPNANKAN